MIKVTLEFPSVDAAIVALGKLVPNAAVEVRRKAVGSDAAGAVAGDAGPSKAAERAADSESTQPAAVPGTRQRGTRSDKGKPRGSYKNVAAEPAPAEAHKADPSGVAPSPAAAPETAASETAGAGQADRGTGGIAGTTLALPPSAAAPETAAPDVGGTSTSGGTAGSPATPGAAVPTAEDAQAALSKVFETHGLPAAQHLLAEFGVSRLRDLPAEKRAEFISAATRSTAIIDIVKGNQ